MVSTSRNKLKIKIKVFHQIEKWLPPAGICEKRKKYFRLDRKRVSSSRDRKKSKKPLLLERKMASTGYGFRNT